VVNKDEYITIYYALYLYVLQYKMSLLFIDLVVAFVLFIFMLVYCCVFSVLLPFLGEKKMYIIVIISTVNVLRSILFLHFYFIL